MQAMQLAIALEQLSCFRLRDEVAPQRGMGRIGGNGFQRRRVTNMICSRCKKLRAHLADEAIHVRMEIAAGAYRCGVLV